MSSGEGHPLLGGSLPLIEPEFLAGILPEVADVALIIDDKGVVRSAVVKPNPGSMTSVDHWVGQNMASLLTEECLPKLQRILNADKSDAQIMHVELNHLESQEWQYPVRYSVHHTDRADGVILLLGRDLRHLVETQQQLVKAQLALEQGYEERREFDARYRMLMSVARESFVLVDVSTGLIQDLNEPAALLLGEVREQLRGKPFSGEFKNRNRLDFAENIFALASAEADARVTYQTKRSLVDLNLEPIGFRAGGQRMLICRLEPEDAHRPMNDQLVEFLSLLFRRGSDAVIFIDGKGLILHANEAFLQMVDFSTQADIKGKSLAEHLLRGQVDLNVLLDNCSREVSLKGYSTKLCSEVGVNTPVDVSASMLSEKANPIFGLTFRDVSTKEASRPAAGGVGSFTGGNAVDLVGSAPLREIVTQTTDVIERMCIETAIELTGNNRAAAAEMLGLSRQSLYVKLNKYDIQDKSGDD